MMLLVLSLWSAADAVEVLDQLHDTSTGGGLEVTANQAVGQIIEAGVAGVVSRISILEIGYHRCTTTDDLVIELWDAPGGQLGPAPLFTEVVPASAFSFQRTSVDVDVSSARHRVDVGDTYAIRLSTGAPGGGCTFAWAGGGSTYGQPGIVGANLNSYWTMEFASYIEVGPEISAAGVCPGRVTTTLSGATPGGVLAWAVGSPGSLSIPGGPCRGTQTSLGAPIIGSGTAPIPLAGAGTWDVSVPASWCGRVLQVIDTTSCGVSAPVVLP